MHVGSIYTAYSTIVIGEPVNFLVIWYNLILMHADLYAFHCSAGGYDTKWLAHMTGGCTHVQCTSAVKRINAGLCT